MFRLLSYLWSNFKEYFILILLLVVSFITLSLNNKAELQNVRAVAFGSFAAVSSIFSDIINTSSLRNENERLRFKNADLMLEVSKLRQYGIQNQELKGLVGLKDTANQPLIPAVIISKSLNQFQGSFTLNVGNEKGVKVGMPVLNDAGLIGIVYLVSDNYSVVRTLKNVDLKITVKDERSRVDGVMKWNGSEFAIVNVPKTYDFKEGDRIITSDFSSILPAAIPVGVVKGLKNLQTGIFNEIVIQSFVDFDKTENVFVLGIVQSKEKEYLELNFYNRN